MRYRLLSLLIVILMGTAGSSAFAEGADDFNKDLQAYQKSATPSASSEDTDSVIERKAAPGAMLGNPLGPAANLPVGKQSPATANALGQVPMGMTQEQLDSEAATQKAKMQQQVFGDAIK
jgi:hypothetical protein